MTVDRRSEQDLSKCYSNTNFDLDARPASSPTTIIVIRDWLRNYCTAPATNIMQPKTNAKVKKNRCVTPAQRPLIIDLTAQFITLNETTKYFSRISPDPPDQYFQHILLGWMKFVAPLTSSSVDNNAHLRSNKEDAAPLLNTTPESVVELLLQVAKTGNRQISEANSFSLLSMAWPTMWIWIQRIYRDHLQMLNHYMDATVTDIFMRRYIVLAAVLSVFVDYDSQPMVAQIIASHPRILTIMADMWMKEGTNKNVVHGFRSALFADPRLAIHQEFRAHILSACGSAEELVHLACLRVERNLGQEKRDYRIIYLELASLNFHMSQELGGPSPIAPALYASSRFVALIMQVWAHVISRSFTTNTGTSVTQRDMLLRICLVSTFSLVDLSPQAYDRILDILDRDFLLLFIKSVSLVHSSSTHYGDFTAIAVDMFDRIICPATVHRQMLLRCVSGSHVRGNFLPPISNPRVHASWSRLLKLVHERENGYTSYKEIMQSVIMCGNEKCDNSRRLLRCSACRISLYCSRECQREKWVSHRTLCHSMQGKIHSCVDLSYPHLHYLSYLVAFDMEVRHINGMTSVLDACAILPGSVPFFFLDYVKLSGGASSIKLMDANDQKPWFPFSDDANLYQEWRQLLVVSNDAVPRLLVAIPRGAQGNAQMMTAAMRMASGGNAQHPGIGIRWLHCQ